MWLLNKNPTAERRVKYQGKMAVELHTLNLDDVLAIGVVERNTMSNQELGTQPNLAMTENWAPEFLTPALLAGAHVGLGMEKPAGGGPLLRQT